METDHANRGLSTEEAAALLTQHGRNELPEPKQEKFKKWIKRFISPMPLMLLAAAGFSFALHKTFDGWFILILFAINLGVSVWHERKTERTLELLKQKVTTSVRTRRDGAWTDIPSPELVVGDLIELTAGSVVPADGEAVKADDASTNESALTGESLPVEKAPGSELLAGSFVAGGVIVMRVTATGGRTRFARIALGTATTRTPSLLEQDILRISKFLSAISLGLALLISAVWLYVGADLFEVIRFDLTLLIAGIPVALQVVMSLIISIGTLELSKRHAIVRRLSALEDLANVDLLLSDKTGTLTKNDIRVQSVELFSGYDQAAAARLAAATASEPDHRPLERAIINFAAAAQALPEYEIIDVTQPDSMRKRSTALAKGGGRYLRIALGAPQIIKAHSALESATAARFDEAVETAAAHGFRTLALAVREGNTPEIPEADLTLVGLFRLSDELRDDAKSVIEFLAANGVSTKLVTGDNHAVSRQVAHELGLQGAVITCQDHDLATLTSEAFARTGVFSEVYPEDKEALVKLAQRRHLVAVTGDGVNDLPAVRAANVGIAVKDAVEVLKQSADIFLATDGIGVIRDAVVESRKIFARIYSYSVYRLSESFRLIITVAAFGILLSAPLLTPVQLIVLALLNDLPIISLAFNRVALSHRPATIDVRRRFTLSLFYGSAGIIQSVLFFLLAYDYFGLPWEQVQTLFFLKLTVSGHMLLYVAHTEARWWRFLPALPVITATTATQFLATAFAFFGWFMAPVSGWLILLVWAWAFGFMQISELVKYIYTARNGSAAANTAPARLPDSSEHPASA